MPKMKTHRGAAKRFKKTATGKIEHAKQGRRHFMSKRSRKRKNFSAVAVRFCFLLTHAEEIHCRSILPPCASMKNNCLEAILPIFFCRKMLLILSSRANWTSEN